MLFSSKAEDETTNDTDASQTDCNNRVCVYSKDAVFGISLSTGSHAISEPRQKESRTAGNTRKAKGLKTSLPTYMQHGPYP